MERARTRRSPPWARWLGWTLAFGLLFAGVVVATFFRVLIPNTTGDLILVFFALTPLAALAIGVRFPSWSWAAGPPAAVLVTVLAILVFPETDPQRPALGESSQKEQFVLMLAGGGAFVLVLLAVAYALLAAAGVGVGRRRGAIADGSARSRLGDDAPA